MPRKQNLFCRIPIWTCVEVMSLVVASSGYDDYTNYGEYIRDHDPDAWNSMDVRAILQRRCVPIPSSVTLCRNVGYTSMNLPNLLGHDSVEEVKRQAAPWVPLQNIGCHPNTDLFLCSLYAPVCLDRPIYPCRSLCESVKNSCEGRMNKYGFEWPDILRCDRFPLGDSLCIREMNVSNTTGYDKNTADVAANICTPCKHPITYESILDSYCWAHFVMKVRIRKVVNDKNDKKLFTNGKLKLYKPKQTKMSNNDAVDETVDALQLVIPDGSNCDCELATKAGATFLVMGTKYGNRFVVTYISDWTKGNEFKRALKAIGKGHDCKTKIKEIAGKRDPNNGGLQPIANQLSNVNQHIIVAESGKDKNKTDKSNGIDRKNEKGNDNDKERDKNQYLYKENDSDKGKVKSNDNNKGKYKNKGKRNEKNTRKGHDTGKNNGKGKNEIQKEESDPMANIIGIGCVPCKQPLVLQNLKEKYCAANFVVKLSMKSVEVDENGDKRLISRKVKPKDFLKQENLSQRDVSKLQPVIRGGSSCDCQSAAKRKKLFIMGHKEGVRHVVTFLSEDIKDSEFRRFQKEIQTGIVCSTAAKTT